MKIEKVNDNQIRCTLTREDLADRQLKLSELAYGTDKAKSLFREMMQQASYEFGFEAEDIPLMIEAIPVSADTVILIITKVEYPEELDTRFSKFSDPDDDFEDFDMGDLSDSVAAGADDILDLVNKLQKNREKDSAHQSEKEFIPLNEAISNKFSKKGAAAEEAPVSIPVEITKLFVFQDLDTLARLSQVLDDFYNDYNTLYKKPGTKKYFLVIRKGGHSPEDFNKVCNIISEYSHQDKYSSAAEAYFDEHYEILIHANAIQTLATI